MATFHRSHPVAGKSRTAHKPPQPRKHPKLDHAQRSALSKNLASAIANHDAGKLAASNQSAANLVRLLRELGILADE
jgi:hypothetical protein